MKNVDWGTLPGRAGDPQAYEEEQSLRAKAGLGNTSDSEFVFCGWAGY